MRPVFANEVNERPMETKRPTYPPIWQILLRKEVIQPHLPIRLPCYDFTPITNHNFGPSNEGTSVAMGFRGVTGGVYKTRERIHRGLLIRDY